MAEVKIISIGDSLGVVLSEEMLAKLHAQQGDKIYVREMPNGIELIAANSEFAKQMDIGKEIMRRDAEVLKGLAK